ncbi:unnamed protein product [Calypogeia fissa]
MTASGSQEDDWWEGRMIEEAVGEAMTVEEEIKQDVAVESSRRAAAAAQPTSPVWRASLRGVVTLSSVFREEKLRDGHRVDAARSGEGQSNGPVVEVNNSNVFLGATGDDGLVRRGGKNEQPPDELRRPIPYDRAPPSMWAGRQGQALRQAIAYPPWVPAPQSPQSSGGWRLLKGDESGSDEFDARREHPLPLDFNVAAWAGGAFRAGSIPVPDLRAATRDALVDADMDFPDRYDPGGELPPYLSAERLRLFVSRANVFSILGSSDGLAEGMAMQSVPESSRAVSPELPVMHIGGASDVEGFGLDVERSNHPQPALRSMLRGPENLHKRAKFLQTLPTRHHPTAAPSRGSSPSSSSRPGSPSGLDRGGQPPPAPLLPPQSQGDEGEPLQPDNAGGEDGDDGEQNDIVADMDDGEVRMDLTDDLLHKVFSFLNDTALCQAAMVCKQWRMASAHEDFWKVLNFEGRHVSHEQVGLLCLRYPKATTLNLKGAPCVDEILVREAMRSLRNLEVLKLSKGYLSDGFFYALAVECSSLQTLSISDATLGSGGAQEIVLRHESLRRLVIFKCRVLRIAIRCPQLDSLCLKRTGTASATLICPRLVGLDVSSCHKLSDSGVRAAATACPLLASLDMSNCAYVSDETLREISMACTNLRSLDASYCPNISLEGVRMPMLIELKLQGCEGILSSSMAALSTCAMLEDLALDFCWLLTAISLDLPRLRQISLTNNRKFVELTLRSPALTKLNLSNCPILNRVDITSSSLQSLVLRQQNGLSSMALQCSWLREVDLSECENLTDAVCDVFSDGGGCPKLKVLILDSCEGLNNVKLSSSSLQSLSLVGCRNIVSLKLVCPVLQQLHLDGCDHLTEASFAPVGLLSLNLGICPHLVKLRVEASQMTSLDLRGCGVLSQAVLRCPALLSLDASYCSQLGDDCLDETTASCPSIQSLVLASCPSVGPVGLLSLKRLKDLTTLDLSYTFLTDLSPIFEACPGLKVLRLSACKYLGDTALDALHGGKVLPELRELDLSYGSLGNSAIEGVMALCPHLSHVSLNGLTHVTDHLWARVSSPPQTAVTSGEGSSTEEVGMKEVLLSAEQDSCPGNPMELPADIAISGCDCSSCTQGGIEDKGKLVDNDPSISGVVDLPVSDLTSPSTELDTTTMDHLDCDVSMDGEVGPVRALQNLSCVGCPHIKKVVIPRFSACFHLSSLNLSLSVNIREVHLSCVNLTSLNLSQCAGLVVLQLDCPRLLSLFLQSCGIEAEMLEQAIQGCDLLETLDVRSCSKVSPAALARMRLVCPGLKRLYSTMST